MLVQKFKGSRAANGWCRGGCLRAGGQAGESPLVPQGGRPASCFPFPASHHPLPPRPAPPSTALRGVAFEGEPDTGALAEDVFLPSGQNISGAFSRGLNTLST